MTEFGPEAGPYDSDPAYSPPPPTRPPSGPAAYGPTYPPPPGYPAGFLPTYRAYVAPSPYAARPGAALGAAVVAYVLAGLLVVASFVLFTGAALVDDADRLDSNVPATSELVFDGIVDLVAAGLLITGGVLLTLRRAHGRTVLLVACALTLIDSVYWFVNADWIRGSVGWTLGFTALAVAIVVLVASPTVGRWLRLTPPRP
jgi:hypothetical protein